MKPLYIHLLHTLHGKSMSEKVLRVPCPACGAEGDWPCTDGDQYLSRAVHDARFERWLDQAHGATRFRRLLRGLKRLGKG